MEHPYIFGINNNALKEPEFNQVNEKRLKKLNELSESPLIIDLSRHYLQNFIPTPVENENEYWMCSCFPSTNYTAVRFNIYWHEVLNIQPSYTLVAGWRVLLFTNREYLTKDIQKQLLDKVSGLEFNEEFTYERGLNTQLAAELPISSYFDFVDDENVFESIRQYNYQLEMVTSQSINRQ